MFKAIKAKLENLGRELETIKSDIKKKQHHRFVNEQNGNQTETVVSSEICKVRETQIW